MRDLGRIATWMTLLMFASACALFGGQAQKPAAAPDRSLDGLVTAYALLEDTLDQESKLAALAFLRKVTFREPIPEIDELMTRLARISDERLEELEQLRALSPDVSHAAPAAPIGDTITANATHKGTREMLGREGSFGVRFVFIQAQATRMVAAISESAAGIEPNERRKTWLLALAAEFEGIRDELVAIIEDYIRQEGAGQQE